VNETVITIKIVHKKPLPKDLTDAIAQRTYNFLYSQGCEAGVSAGLAQMPKEPGKEVE
jgi:hypothetical protein